ncbi:hypothetical protein SH467x_003531 [Pirellulaceae bacterium SH467]
MAQNDKPVHEIRLGKVKAAIWRNETESGTRYGVTFSRIYEARLSIPQRSSSVFQLNPWRAWRRGAPLSSDPGQ